MAGFFMFFLAQFPQWISQESRGSGRDRKTARDGQKCSKVTLCLWRLKQPRRLNLSTDAEFKQHCPITFTRIWKSSLSVDTFMYVARTLEHWRKTIKKGVCSHVDRSYIGWTVAFRSARFWENRTLDLLPNALMRSARTSTIYVYREFIIGK